jgi:hypothetical protein
MQRHGFVMGVMGWSEAGDTRKKGASMRAQAAGKNTAGAVLTVHDDAARGLGAGVGTWCGCVVGSV